LVNKPFYPHHKHKHPNIKSNRVPALGISFAKPNLPLIIEEVEKLLMEKNSDG